MKDNYLAHIGVLFVGVSVLAYFFSYFRYNTPLQLVIVGLGSVYYIVWGILHHAARERLTTLIVLEYVLVGS